MIKDLKADLVATFVTHCRLERSGKGESKLVFLLLRTSASTNSVQVQCRFFFCLGQMHAVVMDAVKIF